MSPVSHLIDTTLDTPYFRSIARRHDRKRFPVSIGSIHPPGPLQAGMSRLATPTFSLRVSGRSRYPLAVLRLARQLRRSGGILHAHCFDATLVGLLAARLAGVPFVFTRHHSDHNLRLNKHWHTRVDAWCARNADHVIAVSEATREIMTHVERVPEAKITVVYNGMEPLPAAASERISEVKASLGLNGGPVCLMVARLHEEKGHRFLFDAIPAIQAQAGPVTFLLAGDGPMRAELEADVKARGLSDCVRFLGRRSDMSELYSLSTVVTLPSLAESFGFAVLEAMSMGKPVVAAATGGMPELVRNGEAGLVAPQADSAALGAAIIQILRDPEEARRMGEAGMRRSEQFTFERMIRGYEAVYERVCAGRGAAHA
ncbi:MAG: glycosyltransferase family 4 protein [Actinomycetota bacterium]